MANLCRTRLIWIMPLAAILLALTAASFRPVLVEASPQGQEGDPEGPLGILLPDLVTLPPTDLRLVVDRENDRRILRFSNTIANTGEGEMEVRGKRIGGEEGFLVTQQLYGTDGRVLAEPVLSRINFHPEHDHWHLEGFARYELWQTGPGGGRLRLLRTSGKVSYCLLDSAEVQEGVEAPGKYWYCNPGLQGISPGWQDQYGSNLAGQWIDVTGLAPGYYALRSVADPEDYLVEANETNNAGFVNIVLSARNVKVLATDHDPPYRSIPGPLQ